MRNLSIKFLAWKYLKSRGKAPIGSTHYLTLAGIALGVMALICVSSVMNGFQSDMQSRLIGSQSEMRIRGKDGGNLSDYEGLRKELAERGFSSSPIIRNELMLKRGTLITPSLSFGIDPSSQKQVNRILQPTIYHPEELNQGLIAGSADSLSIEGGGILLGEGLAYMMQVTVGDVVQVISPLFDQVTAFGLIPKIRNLRVQGLVSTGMPEYDQSYSYIPLQTAAFFAGKPGEIDYLELKTPDRNRVRRYNRELSAAYPELKIEDWSEFDPSLFFAMRFEKFLMFVIMLFMYIIASFNLTGNMLKSISLKKKELGLLKAIGYEEGELSKLFLRQSLILSTIGIVVGFILAGLLLWIQTRFGLIRLPISELESITLPIKIQVPDLVLVLIISYTFTLFSTMIPLKRIREINAVELIRQTA